MKMCLKDPTALFSIKQTDGPFPADSVLLHRGDSIVEMNKERVVIGDTQSHQLLRVNDEDVKAIEHLCGVGYERERRAMGGRCIE